ncbi:MAG TPA: hypothetical protein VIZ22_02565 [Candidatus Limnocylindrales bacterium]
MQTRATRSPAGRSSAAAPATGGPRLTLEPAAGPLAASASTIEASVLDPAGVVDLQATAGNRATVEALQRTPAGGTAGPGLTVQRAVSPDQATQIARRLDDAMRGWGTDEEAIYGALAGRTAADMDEIRKAYKSVANKDLDAELRDELNDSELARVTQSMAPTADESTLTEGERATAATERAKVTAVHLKEAMAGWGTEEDEIFNALTGREPEEILAIQREYLALTGNHLDRDLQDELSGSDLRKALDLLQVQAAGTFTNEIDQHMTEGETTTVQGRFEYVLQQRELTVRVPVDFKPDAGVTAPIATWQSQIDTVWNKFAAVETGGLKIPIRFGIENRSGAEKSIRVKDNKVPGTQSVEDRANAGMWFPLMDATTAPHEFGHLIGLQDEYQRTHGDYKKITGQDITGPANASGKTAAEIAVDLHNALYLRDATQRAPTATTLLTAVGLIVGGVPQQGDFAQEVQTAYNDKYDGWFSKSLVQAMRDKLPEGSKWTIQSVFSYASRSIMGNPEVLGGVTPHDHAVEPRHLEEFVRIVRGAYPDLTWTSGPR